MVTTFPYVCPKRKFAHRPSELRPVILPAIAIASIGVTPRIGNVSSRGLMIHSLGYCRKETCRGLAWR
jgi:hypothetical protein